MRRALSTALLLATILTTAGFRECGGSNPTTPLTDQQKAEQIMLGVGDGFNAAALSIEQGVPIVKRFRLAGKIKKADSLKAAKTAKRIVEVMQKVSDCFGRIDSVGESERRDLVSDINDILKLASEIKGISWEGQGGATSDAQLTLGLTVLAAGSALEVAARSFKDRLPSGFTVLIPSAVKQKFKDAKPALDRDAALLDKSIEELSR